MRMPKHASFSPISCAFSMHGGGGSKRRRGQKLLLRLQPCWRNISVTILAFKSNSLSLFLSYYTIKQRFANIF